MSDGLAISDADIEAASKDWLYSKISESNQALQTLHILFSKEDFILYTFSK